MLGLFKRPEAARPLVLALGDRDLREAAMQALTMIGAPAAETLAACAPDLESELRADAYALLPRLGPAASDPRVQALLAEALDDEASEAAAAAAGALGEARRSRGAGAAFARARADAKRRSRTPRPTRSGGSARATTTRCACSCRAAGSAGPMRPICVARSAPAGAPTTRRS